MDRYLSSRVLKEEASVIFSIAFFFFRKCKDLQLTFFSRHSLAFLPLPFFFSLPLHSGMAVSFGEEGLVNLLCPQVSISRRFF